MAMEENPYAAPRTTDTVTGVRSGKREDLRSVAIYQKGLLLSILLYLLALAVTVIAQVVVRSPLPQALALLVALVFVAAALGGVVFTFLLSIKVYGVAIGLLLGLLAFFPCVGLLVLLAVSSRATTILRQNGIPVGFLGADVSRI